MGLKVIGLPHPCDGNNAPAIFCRGGKVASFVYPINIVEKTLVCKCEEMVCEKTFDHRHPEGLGVYELD